MGYDLKPPYDRAELERQLSGIRFRPRPSLGAQVQGRLRRELPSAGAGRHQLRMLLHLVALTLALCYAIYLFWAAVLRAAWGL